MTYFNTPYIYPFYPYADNRKKWVRDRRKAEHTLKTMGNYPFVLGLSEKKRRKAISAVVKRRERRAATAMTLNTRPATTAGVGLRKKMKKNGGKRRKLKTAMSLEPLERLHTLESRPSTRVQSRRRHSHSATFEPKAGTVPILEQGLASFSISSEQEEDVGNRETETLFHLLDTNNDGLISRQDFLSGLEDPTVKSFLSNSTQRPSFQMLQENAAACIDAFDSLKTANVDGAATVDEFTEFLTTYTL